MRRESHVRFCEGVEVRFLRATRLSLLSQGHLQRVLDEYRSYFNGSRPHQGIGQRRPAAFDSPARATNLRPGTMVDASPVLGGLHHDYVLAA